MHGEVGAKKSAKPNRKASLRASLQQHAQAGTIKRLVGDTGLEPATHKSQTIGNTSFPKINKADANVCANTSSENPLEKLAQAWETLPPEIQAKIAEFVEQTTGKA
jgi:hypothetical protein